MLRAPLDPYRLPLGVMFLSEPQAANLIGVTPRTLQSWRYSGVGPAFLRMGPRRIAYRMSDLEAWATARRSGEAA